VILNGSRVNTNVNKDIFCDYYVIFCVTDPKFFFHNQSWIKSFGDLIIMQQNNVNDPDDEEWYIFLMLFTDGIRIDLSFRETKDIEKYPNDSLTKVLLDKDKIFNKVEPPSDVSYHTRKPNRQEFDETINDLLWCSTNVAKGLWRGELPYAKFMLDVIVRQRMVTLLSWYVGMKNDWSVNTGKAGRWLEKLLPNDIWNSYINTYAGNSYEENWDALVEVGRLTRMIGIALAEHLSIEYPVADDLSVDDYLKKVRLLPKDAGDLI
jgi:aminoglycoside 6-adenylyltransferase